MSLKKHHKKITYSVSPVIIYKNTNSNVRRIAKILKEINILMLTQNCIGNNKYRFQKLMDKYTIPNKKLIIKITRVAPFVTRC